MQRGSFSVTFHTECATALLASYVIHSLPARGFRAEVRFIRIALTHPLKPPPPCLHGCMGDRAVVFLFPDLGKKPVAGYRLF